MSGFNFGQISNIISEVMDSDLIDIKRNIDGKLQEIYSNIKCHISYNSTDNPDSASSETKPIIQSITINLPLWVDIKNDDFLIAKKMSNGGSLIEAYSGRCGNPVVSQSRKKVLMQMNGTEVDPPTPVPPIEPINIIIKYLHDDTSIQNETIREVEKNASFTLTAPIIEGYKAIKCVIDGIEIENTTAFIENVGEENHTVEFIYEVSSIPTMFRHLVNGLYTMDDGSLNNGYHLYKKVNIDEVSEDENDIYTIKSDNVKFIHEDNSKKLDISVGTKIVLIPGNIFVKINKIDDVENGKVIFEAEEFNPTDEEANAYVTGWYDE